MVINNGGNLSVEYFKAYLGLIMAARLSSLDEAWVIAFSRLFNNEENSLGAISFNNFEQAYGELKSGNL